MNITSKDEIVMKLVHYFITEEDYQPIIVNGVKNEIWLENLNAFYKVIRINSNYIHNDYQLNIDNCKIKSVTKQIKKKTFSFHLKTLNILLDVNSDVKIEKSKNIENFKIDSLKDVRKDDNLGGLFPKLKTLTLKKGNKIDNFINITNDISQKSEEDNKEYEKIFKPKKILITYIIIGINILFYLLEVLVPGFIENFILRADLVKNGDFYRLITSMFMHGNILHLALNMYALMILGKQTENYFGKWKFLSIYIFSGICGSLLSCILHTSYSLGASGAIFGLLGALLYFGYHYRLYLGSVVVSQILPVIIMNLVIGFCINSIDNAAHIGGLIGGILITMALGVNKKDDKQSKINGYITSLIYIVFLIILLIRK